MDIYSYINVDRCDGKVTVFGSMNQCRYGIDNMEIYLGIDLEDMVS